MSTQIYFAPFHSPVGSAGAAGPCTVRPAASYFGHAGSATLPICLAFLVRLKYSQMAMQNAFSLDHTFHALADGTRRSMIHMLARGEARSAGELGRQFPSAQPTISKHLKVLEQAGLVERTVEGRVHLFRLRREPLQDAGGWIERHLMFWTGAVEQLDRLLSDAASDDSQ